MVKRVKKQPDPILRHEAKSITYISGNLKHFTEQLEEEFKRLVPQEYWDTAWIELDKEYDYGDSVTAVLQVSWHRPETDAEFEVRIKQEAERLEYRRQHYEQLKKEFG